MVSSSRAPPPLLLVVTCGGLLINKQLGMYQVKKLSHWDVLPITVSFCA